MPYLLLTRLVFCEAGCSWLATGVQHSSNGRGEFFTTIASSGFISDYFKVNVFVHDTGYRVPVSQCEIFKGLCTVWGDKVEERSEASDSGCPLLERCGTFWAEVEGTCRGEEGRKGELLDASRCVLGGAALERFL